MRFYVEIIIRIRIVFKKIILLWDLQQIGIGSTSQQDMFWKYRDRLIPDVSPSTENTSSVMLKSGYRIPHQPADRINTIVHCNIYIPKPALFMTGFPPPK